MAYCRTCGTVLQEGSKFCPECGSPVSGAVSRAAEAVPGLEYSEQDRKKRRKKKGLFRRWWFWVLAVVIAFTAYNRQGSLKMPSVVRRPSETVSSSAPGQRANPTQGASAVIAPTPPAAPTLLPETSPVPEDGIRPEVREFLEAYESCMDEYVSFMRRYMSAGPGGTLSMLADYYRILSRFSEYEEKLDAFDESDLNPAELAYFLEVTNRVNQKLLTVADG